MIDRRVEKCPSPMPLHIGLVSDINITPRIGMSPVDTRWPSITKLLQEEP